MLVVVWCVVAALLLVDGHAQDPMANLNNALAQIEISVQTSEVIDPSAFEGAVGNIRFTENMTCNGFYVGEVLVQSQDLASPVQVDGVSYGAGFEWGAYLNNLNFQCVVPFQCDFCSNSAKMEFKSTNPTNGIDINLVQQLFAPNSFKAEAPTLAIGKERTCQQKVNLQNPTTVVITTGAGLLSQFLDALLRPFLNGVINDFLGETEANFCELVDNVTESLNDLFVPAAGLSSEETLSEVGQAFEDVIAAQMGGGMIDVWGNPLVELLLSSAQQTNFSSSVGGEDGGLLDSLLGFLNISSSELDSGSAFDLLDGLLGSNFSSAVNFTDLELKLAQGQAVDLVELALLANENATDFFSLRNVTLPELNGVLDASLTSLILSQNGTLNATSDFETFGRASVVVPGISMGDLQVSVGGNLSLQVDLSIPFLGGINLELPLSFDEVFNIALAWEDAFVQAALLFAIDTSPLRNLDLKQAQNLLSCIGIIFGFLGISAANAGGSVDLAVSGFFDAIFAAVQNAANALVVPLASRAPQLVSDALAGTDVAPAGDCPRAELNNVTALPFNFSQAGLFDGINSVLESQLFSTSSSSSSSSIEVLGALGFSAVPLTTLALPQAGGKQLELDISLLAIELGEAANNSSNSLVLFDASPASQYFPQGLFTSAQVGLGGVSATLEVRSELQTDVFKVALSADKIGLFMEYFASYSVFDVESMLLGNALIPDCWVARLKPYGGVKDFALDVLGLGFRFECIECPNPVLSSLSLALAQSASDSLGQGISDALTALSLTENFEPDNWEATIAAAEESCAAGFSLSIGGQGPGGDDQASLGAVEQDLTTEYGFLGLMAGLVGMAGLCTLGCASKRGGAKEGNKNGAMVAISQPAQDDGKKDKDDDDDDQVVHAAAVVCQQADDLTSIALCNHPSVSKVWRVLVPVVLIANFVLFVFGHVVTIMRTDIVGQAFGYPATLENVAELSAVETVKDLWDSGSYVLCFLICGLSIVWPYIKLIGLAICWCLPVERLSFERRGSVLLALDQLGKWSLVELFFVAFVNVVLQITIESPTTDPLPADLYELSIVLTAQFTLYTFTAALLLSLAIANVVLGFHESIHSKACFLLREASGTAKNDAQPRGLADEVAQGLALTPLGGALIAFGALSSIALIGVSCTFTVITVDVLGLARPLMDASGQPTEIEISLITFLQDTFSQVDAGKFFFGVCFCLTALLAPVAQLLLLVVMALKRFTLASAERTMMLNRVLCAWCGLEVLVLSVGASALEIKTVSSFIIEEECDFLLPLIDGVLVPAGILDARDRESTCLGLEGRIGAGAFAFIGALVLSNVVHLFASGLFQEYLESRQSSSPSSSSSSSSYLVNVLKTLRLLVEKTPSSSSSSTTLAV